MTDDTAIPDSGEIRDLASQTESEEVLLSWTIMKSLSRQIYQELVSRFDIPTVINVSNQFMIFGTKSSKILIFDLKQKLIAVLDPPLSKLLWLIVEFAVTSLGISYSQKLIVSGHESGHIFIWDRIKKSVVKAISPIPSSMFKESLDGHLASSSILHIAFLGQKDRFISADDTVLYILQINFKGTAFYHEFNQLILMYSITSTRIHNHPREHTLPTTIYNVKGIPFRYIKSDGMRMVALTTPYKLVIMNMKPSPWIVFRFFWESDGQNETKTVSSSCVSWLPIRRGKYIIFMQGESKLPKLAVSFGSKIIVLDIFYDQDSFGSVIQSEISITINKEWKISENIVYMEWMTETVIFYL